MIQLRRALATRRSRALALLAVGGALLAPACAPASGSPTTASLSLGSTCTPGAAGEILVQPSGNAGTLVISTLPGGGLSLACLPGESTTTTTAPTTTTEPGTTTTAEPGTTTSEVPTTTTSEAPTTTTTEVPTTTTTSTTTTTLGV